MQLAACHTLNSSSESEDTHTISASCHSDEGFSAAAHDAPCPSTSLRKPSMPACPACSSAHIHVQPSRHQWAHLSSVHSCMPRKLGAAGRQPHLIGLLLPAQPVALLLLVQAVPHHVGCLLPGGGSRIAITDHPNSEVPGSHWGHEHSEGCQGPPGELSLPLPDCEGQPVPVDPAEVGLPPGSKLGGNTTPLTRMGLPTSRCASSSLPMGVSPAHSVVPSPCLNLQAHGVRLGSEHRLNCSIIPWPEHACMTAGGAGRVAPCGQAYVLEVMGCKSSGQMTCEQPTSLEAYRSVNSPSMPWPELAAKGGGGGACCVCKGG
jgi:hypothetical protein